MKMAGTLRVLEPHSRSMQKHAEAAEPSRAIQSHAASGRQHSSYRGLGASSHRTGAQKGGSDMVTFYDLVLMFPVQGLNFFPAVANLQGWTVVTILIGLMPGAEFLS